MKGARIKFLIVFAVIAVAAWSLWPTWQVHFLMPREKQALQTRLAEATTREESLKVEVEIDRHQARLGELQARALSLGLDLVGGMHLVLEVDRTDLTVEEARDATDRALEVIRNRVDQFGVFEPIIQKVGQDRILVQLPGVERDRAKDIIRQTAMLKFQLVAEERTTYDALRRADERLAAGLPDPEETEPDTLTDTMPEDTLLADLRLEDEAGSLLGLVRTIGADFGVEEADLPEFRRLLEASRPYWPTGFEFLFGSSEAYEGRNVRRLYMVRAEPELLGSAIKDARPSLYQGSEIAMMNTWIVNLQFERAEAIVFAQVTGRNIGRRLAIVLDEVVRSAPVIQTRIPPEAGAIITTGDPQPNNARDLAIVLRSGALPAPLEYVEERSIGPSLGRDSIRQGILAGLIGALAVLLFMLIYYRVGGVLANMALVFNIFFLLAVLAGLRATLTLPGLAGIALTIGMAVDANVLVFERIREELRAGKTTMAAVDTGYDRALVTIIDANATTVITAIALYFIGSGPIRGFAITLVIGLVINVITAVFLTRFIFDWFLSRFEVRKLRI